MAGFGPNLITAYTVVEPCVKRQQEKTFLLYITPPPPSTHTAEVPFQIWRPLHIRAPLSYERTHFYIKIRCFLFKSEYPFLKRRAPLSIRRPPTLLTAGISFQIRRPPSYQKVTFHITENPISYQETRFTTKVPPFNQTAPFHIRRPLSHKRGPIYIKRPPFTSENPI